MNGTTYVFDPNFEYGGYGNGYQINYGMSGTFKYIDLRPRRLTANPKSERKFTPCTIK